MKNITLFFGIFYFAANYIYAQNIVEKIDLGEVGEICYNEAEDFNRRFPKEYFIDVFEMSNNQLFESIKNKIKTIYPIQNIRFRIAKQMSRCGMAFSYKGYPYIILNESKIQEIVSRTKDKLIIYLILSHEIAHFNFHHIDNPGIEKLQKEKQADLLSGWILCKLKVSTENLESVMQFLREYDNYSNNDRIDKIKQGCNAW